LFKLCKVLTLFIAAQCLFYSAIYTATKALNGKLVRMKLYLYNLNIHIVYKHSQNDNGIWLTSIVLFTIYESLSEILNITFINFGHVIYLPDINTLFTFHLWYSLSFSNIGYHSNIWVASCQALFFYRNSLFLIKRNPRGLAKYAQTKKTM